MTAHAVPSPYRLPNGINLYEWHACSDTSSRVRAISATRLQHAFEDQGGTFIPTILIPAYVSDYVQRSWKSRMLSLTKWTLNLNSVGSAAIAAYKTQFPNSGNSKTWALVSVGEGVAGLLITFAEKQLAGDVASSQATITAGVKAALITDMTENFIVPIGGCTSAAHTMFLGRGPESVKGVIP